MKKIEYHSPEKFVMLHEKMEHYKFMIYYLNENLNNYNSGKNSLEAILKEFDAIFRMHERDIKQINEDIKELERNR
jgi:hypothetical protein